MERLEGLRRDLFAFTESRLAAVDRLQAELDASIGDLRKLLDKKRKSEESRKIINPTSTPKPETLQIEGLEYRVSDDFRQYALQVADELDLDEVEAAKLCFRCLSAADEDHDASLGYRALVEFHKQRCITLDCMRLILLQSVDVDGESGDSTTFQETVHGILRGENGRPPESSAYWRKCVDGLTEVEAYLKKIEDHRQTAIQTDQPAEGPIADALMAQRILLTQQHESLAVILSCLVHGNHAAAQDFRMFLSKAASLETAPDITLHYMPIIISGSVYFGADDTVSFDEARGLHNLFARGPGQLQWKQPSFKAAATAFWLAEYSSRFVDPTSAHTLRVADRQKEEEDRTRLFMQAVKDKAFHFMLQASQFLKPETWHDPAKVGLVRYLLEDTQPIPAEIARPTIEFADFTMGELQTFSDGLVANMPDVIRRLKVEEDDRRRTMLSAPPDPSQFFELHLERFLLIMSYAYQDDAEAAQDFWSDRDNNLYGFLRWASQRLPTPRVAAFCELLRSIASDEKSGNQAHRFLLEETSMTGGKLRRVHSVSWSQIFTELELYASSTRKQPTQTQPVPAREPAAPQTSYLEPETYIMLEAYLRLAAHICKISPDARQWILRDQTFHLGETLFQLAATGTEPRVHACCFDVLAALLTDKVPEVNDGMWVLLDSWIAGGGSTGATSSSLTATAPRRRPPEGQYLQSFATHPEAATGLVNLLNALVCPSATNAEITSDGLPFPENLGAPGRHGGIDAYVDFVMDKVFRATGPKGASDETRDVIDVLRCACLQFTTICLATFNEDLVALADSTNVAIDAAIRTSSLKQYVKLHPFARVMEYMLNGNVILTLASIASQNIDHLNALDPFSPTVQSTLKCVQVINLALKLQATYFDVVRPIINKEAPTRTSVANLAFGSYDEVLISQLDAVAEVVTFAASTYTELSLESLALLKKLCSSRKLGEASSYDERGGQRLGSRLVGALTGKVESVASEIRDYFQIEPWDLENGEMPLKISKAQAFVEVLTNSLDTSAGRPSLAHHLLGFACRVRAVDVEPGSAFSQGQALFHGIARAIVETPTILATSNVSWLLALKRGCLQVITRVARSPLTSSIVLPELRAMEFFEAALPGLSLAAESLFWDGRPLDDPEFLLESSALALRDFLHVRGNFSDFAAMDLRRAHEDRAYSVQEKIITALLGTIKYPDGEVSIPSVFDLVDFFDIDVTDPAPLPEFPNFQDLDFSICVRDDSETLSAYDLEMARQLLSLHKRELVNDGTIKDTTEDGEAEKQLSSILLAMSSQNSWRAILSARLSALEAWTDLVSLMSASSGLDTAELTPIALQGLQVVLPRFEKALNDSMDSAALLAKLSLSLVPTLTAGTKDESLRNAGVAQERLLLAFRVCLKAITDSGTGLALRDICYRICCEILTSLPLTAANRKPSPSPNARLLLQLVQSAGDRLIAVITEDAFSGRGVTRVSSILFLDGLITLSQVTKTTPSILRALTKLNFVPVLIDQSIGSVTASFSTTNEELVTAVAYFHTALSLLLRVCHTTEGTQLVLHAGFFAAIAESRLFSTDPDIGLDIDNPVALQEFYRLLSAILRLVTAVVMARGPSNAHVLQQAKGFLQENRFSMQAVFKRTSAVKKTAGPPETEAMEVADEFMKLVLVTGFLEVSSWVPSIQEL